MQWTQWHSGALDQMLECYHSLWRWSKSAVCIFPLDASEIYFKDLQFYYLSAPDLVDIELFIKAGSSGDTYL